jgi:hypothetical protein
MASPILYSYEVIPDRLYAGEYPGHKPPSRLEPDDPMGGAYEKARAFQSFGVSDFIDLSNARDPVEPYEPLLPQGMARHACAIEEPRLPGSFEQLYQINTMMCRLAQRGRRVYVHCRGGVHRTSAIIAGWMALSEGCATTALIKFQAAYAKNPKAIYRPKPEIIRKPQYLVDYINWLDSRMLVDRR